MSQTSASELPADQPTFEQSLGRLEEIVRGLEGGELGLSEALERYEEGVTLLRQCYQLLQRAERRIELLSGVDAEGNPITQPFDDSATFDQSDPTKGRSRRRSAKATPPSSGGHEPQLGSFDVDAP
jgi:exodeoxyribonuclease VII small subunit